MFVQEWSNITEEEEEEGTDENDVPSTSQKSTVRLDVAQLSGSCDNTTDKFSLALVRNLESKKWLSLNVQTDWWNSLQYQKCPIVESSCDANICDIW